MRDDGRIIDTGTTYTDKPRLHEYDSIEQITDAVGPQIEPAFAGNAELVTRVRKANNGSDWTGLPPHKGSDLDAMLAVLRDGWPDGLRRIDTAMTSGALSDIPTPLARKRRRHRGAEGDELDIQRVYAGDLDHAWERSRRDDHQGPQHITIVTDIGGNADVNPDRLFWRGAAAVRLCDLLTDAGYAVRIVASQLGVQDTGERMGCRIVVKDFNAPLDRMAVASVVALPGFFRSVCFAWIALYCRKVSNYGLGRHVSTRALADEFLVSDNVNNAAQARAWVVEQIEHIHGLSVREAA